MKIETLERDGWRWVNASSLPEGAIIRLNDDPKPMRVTEPLKEGQKNIERLGCEPAIPKNGSTPIPLVSDTVAEVMECTGGEVTPLGDGTVVIADFEGAGHLYSPRLFLEELEVFCEKNIERYRQFLEANREAIESGQPPPMDAWWSRSMAGDRNEKLMTLLADLEETFQAYNAVARGALDMNVSVGAHALRRRIAARLEDNRLPSPEETRWLLEDAIEVLNNDPVLTESEPAPHREDLLSRCRSLLDADNPRESRERVTEALYDAAADAIEAGLIPVPEPAHRLAPVDEQAVEAAGRLRLAVEGYRAYREHMETLKVDPVVPRTLPGYVSRQDIHAWVRKKQEELRETGDDLFDRAAVLSGCDSLLDIADQARGMPMGWRETLQSLVAWIEASRDDAQPDEDPSDLVRHARMILETTQPVVLMDREKVPRWKEDAARELAQYLGEHPDFSDEESKLGYRWQDYLRMVELVESAHRRHVDLADDWKDRAAYAICRQCDDDPDAQGDARGNDYRWQDYLEIVEEVERQRQEAKHA
ncbi:hypothetical protein [Thioalkalivibrio sp. ALE19]|uniref:hypothetical protein n=1 Tax=Thioalkalivibrio sp. ALE19 TaxID=1266909 RepID=UPI00040488E3|nr:hypothetical protein [Thioalkalivibrio sp. ALE19]